MFVIFPKLPNDFHSSIFNQSVIFITFHSVNWGGKGGGGRGAWHKRGSDVFEGEKTSPSFFCQAPPTLNMCKALFRQFPLYISFPWIDLCVIDSEKPHRFENLLGGSNLPQTISYYTFVILPLWYCLYIESLWSMQFNSASPKGQWFPFSFFYCNS